jgi:D-alanine--poly(phosphoribitol) ligase subunit 1
MTRDSFEDQCKDSAPIAHATGEENLILDRVNDDTAELLIVGPQLANGYLADTALTGAKFPTLEVGGKMMRAYLSGDLVRIKDDFLYFVGRTDDQIKISGHRLELAEVRGALATFGFAFSVSGIVDGKLCSLIESQSAVDVNALRSRLRETLEPWAVPSVIRVTAALPRNMNGKIVWDPGVFAYP